MLTDCFVFFFNGTLLLADRVCPRLIKRGGLALTGDSPRSQPRAETLTETVRAALALAQDGHPAVGGRTALREALNGAVVAGAAGAGVGFPGVSHQQHVSVVGDAVLLLAAVHRQQGALGLICRCTRVQTGFRQTGLSSQLQRRRPCPANVH